MTKKKAVLVVSFGTSYTDAMNDNIIPAEASIRDAFPGYEFRRAFSSRKIVKKLRTRDGMQIDGVEDALNRLKKDGFSELIVQPTFIIHGFEFDELSSIVDQYRPDFEQIRLGHPLLNTHEDYCGLLEGLKENFDFSNTEEAIVFMGHGTEHFANACYPAMEHYIHQAGFRHVFIGTVEGYPDLEAVRQNLNRGGFKSVTLAPLMLVAGDHAKNDMAGDEEDSWKSVLEGDGINVRVRLNGLGSYEFIRRMFADHAREAA